MSNCGTPSQEFPGWYVKFQAKVLENLPRPGEIDQDTALGWADNGEALSRILREALVPSQPKPEPVLRPARSWREEDSVIYFSVTSDGTTGEEWIKRLEDKGFRVSNYAKSVLRSPDFKPTSGVTTEIAVLKGMLFTDDDRITKSIRAEADKRKLTKPNAEVACLIREKFTDKEIEAMGLWWIVAMHEPIRDAGGDPGLLSADRSVGGRWLDVGWGGPGDRWGRDRGFAFAVPQVNS